MVDYKQGEVVQYRKVENPNHEHYDCWLGARFTTVRDDGSIELIGYGMPKIIRHPNNVRKCMSTQSESDILSVVGDIGALVEKSEAQREILRQVVDILSGFVDSLVLGNVPRHQIQYKALQTMFKVQEKIHPLVRTKPDDAQS